MNTSPEELSENIPDRQAHSVIATAGVDPSNQKNLEIISVSQCRISTRVVGMVWRDFACRFGS
jgi:hypothetical protein